MGSLKRKEYYQKNKEIINRKRAEKRRFLIANPDSILSQKDRKINTRIKKNLRGRTGSALKNILTIQIDELLGGDVSIIRKHIELKFKDGMSWANYGKKWHIDHIIPISLAKTMDEFRTLSHYSNLQPMWAIDNASKGKTIF